MAYATWQGDYPCCFPNAPRIEFYSNPEITYPQGNQPSMGAENCANSALTIKGDANNFGTRFDVARNRLSHDTTDTSIIVQAIGDGPCYETTLGDMDSGGPSVSANGQDIAFASYATNFPGIQDNNSAIDVYFFDRESIHIGLVSHAFQSPSTTANDESFNPAISANRKFIAFTSTSSDIINNPPLVTGQHVYLFARARFLPENTSHKLISRASDIPNPESPPTTGDLGYDESNFQAINDDGTHVAYTSWASNLIEDDYNDCPNIFVAKEVWYDYCVEDQDDEEECFDVRAIETVRVSVSSNGDEANDESILPAISETGRFVTFASTATNLAPGDTLGYYNIFLRDRDSDGNAIFDEPEGVETFRISRAWDHPTNVPNNHSVNHSISGDGRFIVFQSSATNLLDPSEWTIYTLSQNIFLYDHQTATTHLVTRHWNYPNESAIGDSVLPTISADGKWILFTSDSNELHEDHWTVGQRIYIYSVDDDEIVQVIDETEVSGYEPAPSRPVISGDGRFIAAEIWSTSSDPNQVLLHDRGRLNIYDLNGDGCVDNADRQIVSLHMGYDCSVADVNGDGIVAQDDFNELMANWDPCEE